MMDSKKDTLVEKCGGWTQIISFGVVFTVCLVSPKLGTFLEKVLDVEEK